MKDTATTAKTRAAMEKQNAKRTSRVILLLESRAGQTATIICASNTHRTHLIAWAERNKVHVSSALICAWAKTKNILVVVCCIQHVTTTIFLAIFLAHTLVSESSLPFYYSTDRMLALIYGSAAAHAV